MKQLLAFSLAVLLFLLAVGCTREPLPEPTDTVVAAMDTEMQLRLYGDTDHAAAKVLTEELLRLNDIFSPTKEDSVLYRLNRFLTVQDADLAALLRTADELCVRTDGALDVSLLPLSRLWGFIGTAYYIPSEEEILQTLTRCGADKYSLNGDHIQLHNDAALDFGALAKGYAADQCRAYLETIQMPALLSLGGNIQTVGTKPDGSAWLIGVQDPQQPDSTLLTLSVTGTKAVVTSGDYQRYFEHDGQHYCHIFDPSTGSPVQNELRSVTVVADSGALADGLSTALFVMGVEQAAAHWRASNDFEAILIDKNGAITVTAGLADSIAGCEFTVIER